MKINQIINEGINEGLVFYAKNPDGTKTYALVKDAEHLANLEQKYRGAQVQKLDFARQDVQDWLDSRGVNLRRFPPGMETTVGPNQGRPADAPTKPQNVVWRAPGYEPGKGSPFDTSGSTLIKRTNFPAKDDAMAEGMPAGEYSRVLTALKLYYPDKFSMEELNTPEWHRVIANKADVRVEYAGDVINGFVKASQRNDDDYDDEQGVSEGLNEFAPVGGHMPPRGPRTPGGDPWGGDDSGEDPYGTPKPRHYARSSSYFEQFEADHFDDEEFDKETGTFKGYWDDEEGRVQIGYFKFDDPEQTGSDDPGMGWYYEPQMESVAQDQLDEINWRKGLATAAMAAGAMGALSSPAQARVMTGPDGQTTPSFAQQMQSGAPASSASSARMPNQDVQTVDTVTKVSNDNFVITHNNKEYQTKIVPKDFKFIPRGGVKVKVSQAQMGERGIGNYVAYLLPNGTAIVLSGSTAEPANETNGDTQLQPGMQVKDGTIVKVNGNTVTVKTSNGDLMNMNIHDVDVAQNMAEAKKKSEPPEADYGADYQDMVSRVKKLAGLGPLKTVYDPQKRVYKNVPKAEQPKK